MSSPFPTLAVCLCYVYIVKVSTAAASHRTDTILSPELRDHRPSTWPWLHCRTTFHSPRVSALSFQVLGPRIMENRKPLQLKNALVLYNLFQVIFSSWLFYEVSVALRDRASCGMPHFTLRQFIKPPNLNAPTFIVLDSFCTRKLLIPNISRIAMTLLYWYPSHPFILNNFISSHAPNNNNKQNTKPKTQKLLAPQL